MLRAGLVIQEILDSCPRKMSPESWVFGPQDSGRFCPVENFFLDIFPSQKLFPGYFFPVEIYFLDIFPSRNLFPGYFSKYWCPEKK